MVAEIARMSNPQLMGDRVAFTVETDDGDIELSLLTSELGAAVQFFALLADYINAPDGEPTGDLFPIPTRGVGFQDSPKPETKLMVVNVGGLGLGFEIAHSDLADMGERLSRIARALSADDRKKPS